MRSSANVFFLAILILAKAWPSFAQSPAGVGAVGSQIQPKEDQTPPAGADAEGAKDVRHRPAGTAGRPEGGVQHADLDKAWAEYDAAVAKVTESIDAAIAGQFDIATSKGDLEAAEKWQTARDTFRNTGQVPAAEELKKVVSTAVREYKKAKDELAKAYDATVKGLTKEKRISEAKAVRDESRAISEGGGPETASRTPAKPSLPNAASGPDRRSGSPKAKLNAFVVEALIDGDSELCVTPKGIYWKSLGVAKPGRHNGRNEPTFVNGQPWMPQWGRPIEDRGVDQTGLLPLNINTDALTVEVVAVGHTRGEPGKLSRTPTQVRREDGVLAVVIPDKDAGPVWYTLRFSRLGDAPERAAKPDVNDRAKALPRKPWEDGRKWVSLASNPDEFQKFWVPGDKRGSVFFDPNTHAINIDSPWDLGGLKVPAKWTEFYFEIATAKTSFGNLDMRINDVTFHLGPAAEKFPQGVAGLVKYDPDTRVATVYFAEEPVAKATVLNDKWLNAFECALHSGGGGNAKLQLRDLHLLCE